MSRSSRRVRDRLSSLTRPPPCKMASNPNTNTKPIAKYVDDVLKSMENVPKWAKPLNFTESEAYSRRDNLLFYGIKEDAWETPALLRKKLDEQVLSKLNIPKNVGHSLLISAHS